MTHDLQPQQEYFVKIVVLHWTAWIMPCNRKYSCHCS